MNLRHTIAIHESKNSDKVVKFVTGVDEMLPYCSKQQAIRIQKAQEEGRLWGVYFTKSGSVRATYNW